ncbi:MAG: hypothetical protein FWF54_09195 [Candidatus Azobacteroides sp.]|nr:hypothetical protein [Candidatus Azobacteroides sp.]
MSEYDDLSDSAEVFEPNSEGFHEETEPIEPTSDIIPEDTQSYNFEGVSDSEQAEAEEFMKENPDLFSNSDEVKTPTSDGDEGVLHNPDSESITVGKLDPDKNETGKSYIETGKETGSSYYDNENYPEIQKENPNIENKDMYEESGNKETIENALDKGQEIQMPTKPEEVTGTTEQEYKSIQNQTGVDVDELKKLELEEDNMRHLRDYKSYSDEQPLDKLEDEEWN